MNVDIDEFKLICEKTCESIYKGKVAPPKIKVDSLTKLLFMTAAHESDGFNARRQYGFRPNSYDGAFSLFQVEWNTIDTCINRINNYSLSERLVPYLKSNSIEFELNKSNKTIILSTLQKPVVGDVLGAVFARIKYMGVKEEIPTTLEEMAKYAKKWYNTEYGKATPDDYLKAFKKHW